MKKVKLQDVITNFKNIILQNKRNIFFICLLSYLSIYILSLGSIKIANIIFSLFVVIFTIIVDCGVIVSIDKCSKENIQLTFKDIIVFSKSKLKLGLFWYILMAFLNSMIGIFISSAPFKLPLMALILLSFLVNAILTPFMIISISGHTIVNKKNYIYIIGAMLFILWINFIPFIGEALNFLLKPFLIIYLISLSKAENDSIKNLNN